MAPVPRLMFGNTPVPWTVSWSGENNAGDFIAPCRFALGREAICQKSAPGEGRPAFGKPHAIRQRHAIALCLCDLCGLALKQSTKVSLSHARLQAHGAAGPAILQVEPLLHKVCALQSLQFCPSLRRDIRQGSLFVRQVHRWRAQFAIMDADYVKTLTGQAVKAVGHAKVELLKWTDRDEAWLGVA